MLQRSFEMWIWTVLFFSLALMFDTDLQWRRSLWWFQVLRLHRHLCTWGHEGAAWEWDYGHRVSSPWMPVHEEPGLGIPGSSGRHPCLSCWRRRLVATRKFPKSSSTVHSIKEMKRTQTKIGSSESSQPTAVRLFPFPRHVDQRIMHAATFS